MSEQKPKVTVLMSVYNSECYLRACIESILAQTFKDFEFLIIDDGSSDKSRDIIRSYGDPRIRLLENKHNLGLAASLNRGLSLARGAYIARMDADDICHKQRLEKQARLLDSRPEVGVCGSFFRWIKGGKKSRVIKTPVSDQAIKATLLFKNALAHPTVMFRIDTLRGAGAKYREDFSNSQDYALWADLARGTCFYTIPEVLLYYRLHAGQITATKDTKDTRFIRQIQTGLLEQVGITGTKALALHYELYREEGEPAKKYLFSMLRYLVFLIRKNDQARCFPALVFRQTVSLRWFTLCRVLSARGHKSYCLYRRSSLKQYYRPPFREMLLFELQNLRLFFKNH